LRIGIWTLALLVGATSSFSQSLGDVARREKERREQNQREGVTVLVVTEDAVRTSAASDPGEVASFPGDLLEGESSSSGGAPASDFSLPDRSGRTVSLRDLRGRPVLIDFWATWCGPCRKTMPEVERIHRKYGANLQVLGINLEGRTPEVLAFLDKAGYSFRVLFDEGNFESGTASRYGVRSIPRTFLLDREGRILFAGHPQALSEEQIEASLRE
jgi:thiol-disulfide isomerase/thioredoxin